jgi:hypothetical protein
MTAQGKRAPFSVLLAVFLVSFSVLGFEICITRIYSLIFSYYYVFLAISVAMFGFGIGGFIASARHFENKDLITISILLAISFPLAIILPFTTIVLLSHPLLLSLTFLPPFILSSLFIALVFRSQPAQSGYIYFADLTGAGIGSLAVVLLLSFFSPINVIFLFSLLVIGAIIFLSRKVFITLICFILAAFLLLNKDHRIFDVPYHKIPVREGTKTLVSFLKNKQTHIEKTYWNPSFRTDVIYYANSPNTRGIFVDGGAPTIMFQCTEGVENLRWLEGSLNYFPFSLSGKKAMLSIGPGGGLDMILGLLAGVDTIEAIEINSSILQVLHDYRNFNGDLLALDNLAFSVGEGRNHLKRTKKEYDLIYLSLAQTSTSSKMGVPLAESYLHTIDACVDYFHHLKSDGFFAIICETDHFLQRSVFNVLLALHRMNTDFILAKNHLIIIENYLPDSPYRYLLLARKNPLAQEEGEVILATVSSSHLIPHHIPYSHERYPAVFSSYGEIKEFLSSMKARRGIDVSPTTDEKPFFYDLHSSPPQFLFVICIVSLLISTTALFFVKNKASIALSPYFFLLGAGFILIENAMIQKFIFFLGLPVTTFSVILFSLLLGCGVGGFMVQSTKIPFKILYMPVAALCLIIFLSFLFLHNILLSLFGLGDPMRVFLTVIILFPFGILLGMPFPTVMRRLGSTSQADVGLMWGINGLMALFGGSLSMVIAKVFGFSYMFLFSLLIYVIVLILLIRQK